jgi:hypothetical protein
MAPVPNAGIFLFDNLDQYTGIYAATDVSGHYCLANVPSGTYTVQVRVDNYITAEVHDVLVDDVTGVDIQTQTTVMFRQPWPNPATDHVNFGFDLRGGISTSLEVYDIRGRFVKGWRGQILNSGANKLFWNLRDFRGNPIAAGVYMVRLRTGDTAITRRFIHVR